MKLNELTTINFATADSLELEATALAVVEGILNRKLERADPLRLFIKSLIAVIMQQRLLIDQTAKMNLLAYATGNYLEHLGALVGCERLPASSAVTTVEVTLSTVREVSTTIKQGTRVTADDEVYFALEDDVVILAGESTAQAKATCTVTGEVGNGYAAGEICRVVAPQAFLLSIVNVTTSEGGADVETDDAYRERIHEAPEAYSCAGSEGAYQFHTKSVNHLIVDVAVDSETPGTVQVYPLLKDGELPGEEILSTVYEYLDAKTVRPLTDQLSVRKPIVENYDVDVSYWVSRSDAIAAAAIEEAAQQAVTDYVEWQRSKLGRDINPTELVYRLKKIGVKRVDVRAPIFTATNKFTVAIPINITATFEGLEDE